MMPTTKVALLGTGLLGSAMAESMLQRGVALTVWNRSQEKARALGEKGASVAASAADAVRGAERVHIVLSDDAAVDSVLDACGDALGGATFVVDHTTTSPAGTVLRAERLARAGVPFLHAPVFMGPQMARESKGIMLAAGPSDRFERARSALAAMTGDLWHVGERVDLAAVYKLFGNAMIITITGGLADVFAMARGAGLDPKDALNVFSRFKPGGTIEGRGAKMAKGDFSASFELTMARKDVRLMVDLAATAGVPMAVLPGIADRMDALIAAGRGAQDLAVLAAPGVEPDFPREILKQAEKQVDPFAQLLSSHRRLEERLADLRNNIAIPEVFDDVLRFLDRSVRRHEEDEEKSLFPRLAHRPDLAATIATLNAEHRTHEALQDELRHAPDLDTRRAIARDLESAYKSHIAEEERSLFPAAREALDGAALTAISEEMQSRRGGGGGGGGGGGRRRNGG